MRRTHLPTLAVIGVMALSPAFAQKPDMTGDAVKVSEPGKAGVAHTAKISAEVVSIDKATRTLTLKGPKGNLRDVECGPEVKNFAHIKVGDLVAVQYVEALTLELKKNGSTVMTREDREGSATSKPGEKPAAAKGRLVTVMANVVAVDPKAKTITLKGPKGHEVVLDVKNPEQFKVVKVGDQVEAQYLEALAISVEETGKHAPSKGGEPKK